MKIPLEKVTKKINIEDYSLKEIAKYFEKFDNYILIIKTNIKTLKIKIHKNIFPHLIGLQYFSHSSKFKGNEGLNNILNNNIDLKDIKNNLKYHKNYTKLINNIFFRIEYLPMFFNTISYNSRIKKIEKDKLVRNTLLKGNYLLFKQVINKNIILFPILSLKLIKNNSYVIETFIVENNISLLGTLNEEKIINIEFIPPRILQKVKN